MSRRYAALNGWRWVGWYVRRGRVLAALRQAWLAYVVGYDSEACQDCGRSYVLWHADDDLYGRVTGRWADGAPAGGLFCPGCFDRTADRRGITLMWNPTEYGQCPERCLGRKGHAGVHQTSDYSPPPDPADLARWLQDTFESQPAITIQRGVEPQVAWRALADELLRRWGR